MAMKQTQTKLFDFSDVGLDFCAGSKNLFPDRFKKMLSLGYNVQTVSSVAVAGNQVTFTYGGAHGYSQDRVLKVDSGALASINSGEFWIDSITTNTVTFTLDAAPVSIASGFTTRIASLNWQLVYEQAHIHIYKFKAIDETDLYIRLCFQNYVARRNCISPCVGKSFDPVTGVITDDLSLGENRSLVTPGNGFKWEYGYVSSDHGDYTYSDGYSLYGKGCIIGSLYHFVSMHNIMASERGRVVGVLPTKCLEYDALNYPVLIGETYGNITSFGNQTMLQNAMAYVGNVRVKFDISNNSTTTLFQAPQATASFLTLDTFNTTTVAPIFIYQNATLQLLGAIAGGVYVCKYSTNNRPTTTLSTSPGYTYDIDLNAICPYHFINWDTNPSNYVFLTAPIEEIKIV